MIIIMYMDDLLVFAPNHEECLKSVRITVDVLEEMGFLINRSKCTLEPSQTFVYLGCEWNTNDWTVALKPDREDRIRLVAQLLLEKESVKYRTVAKLLGMVISSTSIIPIARARIRSVQWEFLRGKCVTNKDYNRKFVLSAAAKAELYYWANLQPGLNSPITLPEASHTVTTDASEFGFGIYYKGVLVSEKIDSVYSDQSINVKELLALSRFLELYPEVENCTVTWRVDNNSALASIRNQGSVKSWPLCVVSVNILKRADARNIIIEPIRISSTENIIADSGSRFKVVQDWSLADSLARKLFNVFGTPDVDLMASDQSRKCPIFYSWTVEDQEAWGTDSLAKDVNWAHWSLPYCFPPFPLLPQVLQKVRELKVLRMILVAPWWPTKPYFPTLLSMLVSARKFRLTNNLLIDLTSNLPPRDVKRLRLVGCLISGSQGPVLPDSPEQPRTWWRHPGGCPQKEDTDSSGNTGSVGVKKIMYKQLRHL